MSKNTSFSNPPAPLASAHEREAVKHLPLVPHKMIVYGGRESDFTTVTFIIQPKRGVDDLLMIGLDEHNGEEKSRLMIRGSCEAREIPSQLRWLADEIEKEIGRYDPSARNEYVTWQKSRGGGA